MLGFAVPHDAIKYLADDEKGRINNPTPGGTQQMSFISEPGLYSLILKSRKPEAKVFKRWVNHDVLPAIRQDGMTMPKFMLIFQMVIDKVFKIMFMLTP